MHVNGCELSKTSASSFVCMHVICIQAATHLETRSQAHVKPAACAIMQQHTYEYNAHTNMQSHTHTRTHTKVWSQN